MVDGDAFARINRGGVEQLSRTIDFEEREGRGEKEDQWRGEGDAGSERRDEKR